MCFGEHGEIRQYDTTIYMNVLEHIEDDIGELKDAWSALRDGGRVIIFVPALWCLYSSFDRKVGHYRRYNRRALEDRSL